MRRSSSRGLLTIGVNAAITTSNFAAMSAAKFVAAIAAFTPIVSNPIDENLCNVRQILLQICLPIELAGLKSGKVTGMILGDVTYLTQPGVTTSFDED